MIKLNLIYSAFYYVAAAQYNFSAFPYVPPGNSRPETAPINPIFTSLYKIDAIPIDSGTSPANSINVPTCPQRSRDICSWTCDGCISPDDITGCINWNDFGLSFDDGPSEFTPVVLKLLKDLNIKATFFVVGAQVIRNPQYLKQAYDDGHQIGIHTWSHRALTTMTNEKIISELEYCAQVIQTVIGVRPKYFRPPMGDIDNRVRAIAKAMDLIPVLWNFDSRDWSWDGSSDFRTLVDSLSSALSSQSHGNLGKIILEHDMRNRTVFLAPYFLNATLKANMNPIPVAECRNDSNPYTSLVNPPIAWKILPPPNIDEYSITTERDLLYGSLATATFSSSDIKDNFFLIWSIVLGIFAGALLN